MMHARTIATCALGLAFFTHASLLAASAWWLLGAAFAVGIYAFERIVARALREAD